MRIVQLLRCDASEFPGAPDCDDDDANNDCDGIGDACDDTPGEDTGNTPTADTGSCGCTSTPQPTAMWLLPLALIGGVRRRRPIRL